MELDFNSYLPSYNTYEEIYLELSKLTFKMLGIIADPIISVSFVSKEEILSLNSQYRHIDKVTDVISFAFLD